MIGLRAWQLEQKRLSSPTKTGVAGAAGDTGVAEGDFVVVTLLLPEEARV